MKKNQPLLLTLFLLLSLNGMGQNGVIVEGAIKDLQEEYVMLAYTPRMRGNLNFDGFKSIGARVNAQGKFKLESQNNRWRSD